MSPQRLGCPPALSHRVPLGTLVFLAWGHAPDSDLILRDPTVSRRHGALRVEDSLLTIEDHSSCNGSCVLYAGISRPLHAASWSTPLPLDGPITLSLGAAQIVITQHDDALHISYPG